MNIEVWPKRYLLVSWMFLISTTFTVAKMVRDQQEADMMARQIQSQRDAAAEPAAERRAP